MKRRNAELEQTSKSSRRQRLSLCGERPALTALTTAQVCAFIADHRDRFGVAPICRALSEHGVPIAPRTFYAWRCGRRRNGPCGTPPSLRCWPATTNPTSRAAANRSRCTDVEEVGPPAARRHPGGQIHGGAVDAAPTDGRACAGRKVRTTIADPGGAATGSGRPSVRGTRTQSCWSWRTSPTSNWSPGCSSMSRSSSTPTQGHRGLGSLGGQADPIRGVRNPPGRSAAVGQGHPLTVPSTTRMPDLSIRSVRFGETLTISGLRPSVGSRSAMPTITRWPRPPSGSTRTNASAPIHRRRGPLRTLSDVELSPPTTSLGTTRAGSCTALAVSHPPRPKPTTSSTRRPTNRPASQNPEDA